MQNPNDPVNPPDDMITVTPMTDADVRLMRDCGFTEDTIALLKKANQTLVGMQVIPRRRL